MKHLRLLSTLLATVALVFTACDGGGDDDGGSTPASYAIGDIGPSGVGIVFYVTDGGLHGFEVAPVDQDDWTEWSNIDTAIVGATGIDIGTGSANTDAIIGQSGHTSSAAKICRDYRAANEGDWFLPSLGELQLVYYNLHQAGLGGFDDDSYWCSTEITSTIYQARCLGFHNGWNLMASKSDRLRVRAIRAF